MVQHIKKAKVKIVPRDGEIEITLNINISLDGKLTAIADNAATSVVEEKDEKEITQFIPNFSSMGKLDFGKKE